MSKEPGSLTHAEVIAFRGLLIGRVEKHEHRLMNEQDARWSERISGRIAECEDILNFLNMAVVKPLDEDVPLPLDLEKK